MSYGGAAARRPYVPIDTCSPAGTWVEEKRYNRQKPTGQSARKVLCGNWYEERALEDDLLGLQAGEAAATKTNNNNNNNNEERGTGHAAQAHSWHASASLDIIRDKGTGHYTGGFNSSPYLTCDLAHPTARFLTTTQRADYNATSSNVKALYRPALGVRSQLLLAQSLEAAEAAKAAADEMRATRQEQQRLANASAHPRTVTGGFSRLDALQDTNRSVYKATICAGQEPSSPIDELHTDYLTDEPITLYTGNPETQTTMFVHGKTPIDPLRSSRFGKHTYFSDPKYAL